MSSILAVDDSPISLQIYEKTISPHYSIELVSSAEEALIKLSSSDYHLIICDVNLPEMSGIEFLQKIRKQSDKESIPFIIISADRDSISKAKNVGTNLWLLKPVAPTSLLCAIRKLLQEAH